MKYLCPGLLILVLISGCNPQISEEQRVSDLKNYKTKDGFMNAFLSFLKESGMDKTLVSYESYLLKSKKLKGTDEASYKKYFEGMIKHPDDQCVPAEIKERMTQSFFVSSREFIAYKEKALKDETLKTKEFNILNYLSEAGMPDMGETMKYALEDNLLTIDKRYFYLMCTVPFKECDER